MSELTELVAQLRGKLERIAEQLAAAGIPATEIAGLREEIEQLPQ